jgi:hypothetical protein
MSHTNPFRPTNPADAHEQLATQAFAQRATRPAHAPVQAEEVSVHRASSATYRDLQKFIDVMHSPGRITGGEISAGTGNSVVVMAGTGMVRLADDNVSELRFVDWDDQTFEIPNDGNLRFFGYVYAPSNPLGAVTEMRTTFDWDKDTEIPLGSAVNISGTLFTFSNPYWMGDPITNIIQRFDALAPAQRDNSVGGLILGETGTRNITLSAGVIWSRLTDFAVAAVNTSVSGGVGSAYYNGTNWVFGLPTITQWPNTQYNDVASGLVTMNNNYYANLWFYVAIDSGTLFFLYGQAQHNQLADAVTEGPPSVVPTNLPTHALLIARLTFQKSAAAASQISQASDTVFQVTPVTNHNNLSGLQGGATGEYYHLTANYRRQIMRYVALRMF